jgi:hypothetical protein
VGAAIGKYNAARIPMPLLTHYSMLNYPCAPKKVARASDGENSGSPFLNPDTVFNLQFDGTVNFELNSLNGFAQRTLSTASSLSMVTVVR